MKNAYFHITSTGYTIANFYNTTEVHSIKGFPTARKAANYCKKWGYTVTEKPDNIKPYEA